MTREEELAALIADQKHDAFFGNNVWSESLDAMDPLGEIFSNDVPTRKEAKGKRGRFKSGFKVTSRKRHGTLRRWLMGVVARSVK